MTQTLQKHFHPIPIPPVIAGNQKSLEDAVRALTEGYESLSRQRGEKGGWMVTFTDLIEMGVITEETANEHLARFRGI